MKYELINDRLEHKKGTIVYDYVGHDYGLASDDTNYTGVEHISVTRDPEGGTPFFTTPIDNLLRR